MYYGNKILAILYFYRFIIIFNLTLQQVLLWLLNWTRLEIFVNKCTVSLFHLHLKKYNKSSFWRKSIRSSLSAFSKLYVSQGNCTNWKHGITIFWRYLKLIWKNVCQKAIKTNWSSSRNTSNVPMFCYHVIKMNEV